MSKATRLAPIHPGEILREEYLRPMKMTPNALAKALSMDAPAISDIVNRKRGITAKTALRLAKYFDTTPDYWMNLQSQYELATETETCGSTIEMQVIPMAARAH